MRPIVLRFAGIEQTVAVASGGRVGASAAANFDAVTIDEDTLANLPVLDRDFIATMSRFIDPGSLGNGGVTIVQNRPRAGRRLSSS